MDHHSSEKVILVGTISSHQTKILTQIVYLIFCLRIKYNTDLNKTRKILSIRHHFKTVEIEVFTKIVDSKFENSSKSFYSESHFFQKKLV